MPHVPELQVTPILMCCDRYFDDMLRDLNGGSIHSIFSNAVNFIVGTTLYTVMSGHPYPAPFTGNLKQPLDFSRLGLTQGAPVRTDGCRLSLSQKVILDGTKRSVACITKESYPFCRSVLTDAILAFDKYVREGNAGNRGCMYYYGQRYLGRKPEADMIDGAVGQRIDEWLCHVSEDNGGMIQLEHLIGAGGGLTPSGDDFFCGFFAVLDGLRYGSANRKADVLRNALSSRLAGLGTTDVSRQMLKVHLEGLMPAPHSRLKRAFLHSPEDIPEAMRKIEGVGHSSGLDFSVGAAVAIRYILENDL